MFNVPNIFFIVAGRKGVFSVGCWQSKSVLHCFFWSLCRKGDKFVFLFAYVLGSLIWYTTWHRCDINTELLEQWRLIVQAITRQQYFANWTLYQYTHRKWWQQKNSAPLRMIQVVFGNKSISSTRDDNPILIVQSTSVHSTEVLWLMTLKRTKTLFLVQIWILNWKQTNV